MGQAQGLDPIEEREKESIAREAERQQRAEAIARIAGTNF